MNTVITPLNPSNGRGAKMPVAKKTKMRAGKSFSREDQDICNMLHHLKDEIDRIEKCLNTTADEDLIDSYIYELKATQSKYKFYLNLAKAKELTFRLA